MPDTDAGTTPIDAAANPKSGQSGIERASGILGELVEATRSLAEMLADEQRARASAQVATVAGALRCAAQSLAQSRRPTMAHYTGAAAERIEHFADAVRKRRWREIVADIEDFARRQPVLFTLAAMAAGFAAGRVLSITTDRQRQEGGAAESNATPAVASNPVSAVREII